MNVQFTSCVYGVVDGHLTYKRKRNCKQSKPFKCFNTTIPIPFSLQESSESTYFTKGYLFTRKKRLPGVIFSREFVTGEYIFPL